MCVSFLIFRLYFLGPCLIYILVLFSTTGDEVNSAARPIRPYDRSTSPHIGLYSPNLPSPDFSIQHEYLSIGPTIDVCHNTHASQ